MGTLMAPGVLYRVIYGTPEPEAWQHKLTTFRPALLAGHRRQRVYGCSYPAIVPCDGSTVRGSVVTGLTQGDFYRLDIFEGYQYERVKVKVRVLKGVGLDEKAPQGSSKASNGEAKVEEVEAETYVWKDDIQELEDGEWDFEEFKREKMLLWMGATEVSNGVEVDEGFKDVDEAVRKDAMGGRGNGGDITKQLEGAW